MLDNHASHLSVEALDVAAANGVHILSFPPHCSHKLQPLDVSVFGPIKGYYKFQCSAWQKNNANKVLEIRQIAGLVCKTLDLALTPKIIKAGFAATGIVPFNPDIFGDSDFVSAVEQNKIEAVQDDGLNEEQQRRIILVDARYVDVGHEEEVETSEPSTSEPSMSQPTSSLSRATSSSSVLDEIGPLQAATPKKPSNRGRKPMSSTEQTSPDIIAALKEKKARATPKKATLFRLRIRYIRMRIYT